MRPEYQERHEKGQQHWPVRPVVQLMVAFSLDQALLRWMASEKLLARHHIHLPHPLGIPIQRLRRNVMSKPISMESSNLEFCAESG